MPASADGNTDARFPSRHFVPLAVLIAVVGAFGILFYKVVQPLLLPLFLAAVTAMLAAPLYQACVELFQGRKYLAAGAVTALVLVLVVGPLATGVYFGILELSLGVNKLRELSEQDKLRPLFDPDENPQLAHWMKQLEEIANVDSKQIQEVGVRMARSAGEYLYGRTGEFLGDVVGFVVGIVLFFFALFFFLVDGESILQGWEELTPMDPDHDKVLRGEFVKVCRGVVWATVVAGVAQGILLGLGLFWMDWVFNVGLGKWIFLISLVTMGFSMIPFIGAAGVWAALAALFFAWGNYWAAATVVLWGALFVSSVDNLIKIVVLKDSANLHPLLVFVCVFGGIELVGVLGIFVGPIVGAVLFSLLRILKRELLAAGVQSASPPPESPSSSR